MINVENLNNDHTRQMFEDYLNRNTSENLSESDLEMFDNFFNSNPGELRLLKNKLEELKRNDPFSYSLKNSIRTAGNNAKNEITNEKSYKNLARKLFK